MENFSFSFPKLIRDSEGCSGGFSERYTVKSHQIRRTITMTVFQYPNPRNHIEQTPQKLKPTLDLKLQLIFEMPNEFKKSRGWLRDSASHSIR